MAEQGRHHEFDAAEAADLLGELDRRLRDRGAAAAVFVVGGAAVVASGLREGRLTTDIDALTDDAVVFEVAREIAVERDLPPQWLNSGASMWMPPHPEGALVRPATPGLAVRYADEGFLLATKLVSQRAKDAADVIALADRLGMGEATGPELEAHIRHYYTDVEALAFILDGDDVDSELRLLSNDAARALAVARNGRSRPSATQEAEPVAIESDRRAGRDRLAAERKAADGRGPGTDPRDAQDRSGPAVKTAVAPVLDSRNENPARRGPSIT
ncbi:hypothetical protein [Nocardioides alkalitolerans]|uniref:hypothetical protein n=1 Tax=Nocardioides alkalitolerans TaxID=281714 RepID=UPI00048C587E|nr:hypothetical protein [Nocardioides alkalitolerans]